LPGGALAIRRISVRPQNGQVLPARFAWPTAADNFVVRIHNNDKKVSSPRLSTADRMAAAGGELIVWTFLSPNRIVHSLMSATGSLQSGPARKNRPDFAGRLRPRLALNLDLSPGITMCVHQLEADATPAAMSSPDRADVTAASTRVGVAYGEGAALFYEFSARSSQRGRGIR
jgi:hypothetical protein